MIIYRELELRGNKLYSIFNFIDIHSEEIVMAEHFEIQPHHCGLSVPDLEASIKWYQDVLGFTLAKRMKMGEAGEIAFLKSGDFYIELFEITGSKPPADFQNPTGQELGIQGTKHLALQVKDINNFAAHLKQKGIEPIVPGGLSNNNAGDSPRALFIRDNSGIMLEIVPPSAPE